jgi:hypothetical protein
LPVLAGYFIWKRRLPKASSVSLVLYFVVAMIFANAYPGALGADTMVLTVLHLPIALWLVIGFAYAGERWDSVGGRMDFVRFSGELFIYYVLFALGGGVLTLFTVNLFSSIGVDVVWLAAGWLLPCGSLGAVIVGAWLVEASPNRVAALGENLVLLANLTWSAWLYLGFIRGHLPFATLERWQTRYLPVYSLWAAIVVIVFPPLFGFR